MTTPVAIGARIIGPIPTLLGSTGDALENLICGALPTGSLAWVIDQSAFYFLDRTSTAPVVPPTVIATGLGATQPGRWFRQDTGGGDTPFTNGFWVDANAPAGGNGSTSRPFNTVTDAAAACPSGGTLLILPGDYSGEAAVALADKSLTFFGFAGQRAPSLIQLPVITYASLVNQHLCFRNVIGTVEAVGGSASTNLAFTGCADVTLAGAGNTALVRALGDPSCTIRGEAGSFIAAELVVEAFVSNGVIGINNCELRGNLSAVVAAAIYESLWSVPSTVTAPLIQTDSFTLSGALSEGTTFSVTPEVRASFLGNTPGFVLTCQADGFTWLGQAPPLQASITGTAHLAEQTVPSDSGIEVTAAVANALIGDFVIVKSQGQPDAGDLTILPPIVNPNGTVRFFVQNRTGGDITIDPPGFDFELLVLRP